MDPFDLPPSGERVPLDPPSPESPTRSRGRAVAAVVLTAGLIGGGIAGISQLASADRPDLAAPAPDTTDPTDTTVPPDDTTPTDDGSGADDSTSETTTDDPDVDGEIVIDTGDGDPLVLDLGAIDAEAIDRLDECLDLPEFGLPSGDGDLGEWEPGEIPFDRLEEFLDGLPFDLDDLDGALGDLGGFGGDGGSVTITGPDGVSVVDLGENGSVTVTKDGSDVTISTDGDATVSELSDLFGDLGEIFGGDGSFEFDDEGLDEFVESMPALDELPGFDEFDPEAVLSCVDEVLGR